MLEDPRVKKLLQDALHEDLGSGDVTTEATIPPGTTASAEMLAKEDMILAGVEIAQSVFSVVDTRLIFSRYFGDGKSVATGARIAAVHGEAASILKAERVALNFLQHLCGVATMTAAFVARVSDLPVRIFDTRKTIPGLRTLEKYAVRMGGGSNHRMGLYDAVLIKDNHIAVAGGISQAVRKVRERSAQIKTIEVEVTSIAEAREALSAGADVIMLDNMDYTAMRAAVDLIGKRVEVEASGNISLENVREVALTGVDRISIGALTHSVRAADISLTIKLSEI
jgi:nicotinate-nucleotide pyrophosphorylase (carboxylating)